MDHIKERLFGEWFHFDQSIIDTTVKQWWDGMHKCIDLKGHYENLI